MLFFLKDNNEYEYKLEECATILKEFDSKSIGEIEYDDFLLMVLPWTDLSLREDVCL